MPEITTDDVHTMRVMRFDIPYNEPIVSRIISELTNAEMPYLFVNKDNHYVAYIHKGNHEWSDVLEIVQRIYDFKYRYTQCFYCKTRDGKIKLIY